MIKNKIEIIREYIKQDHNIEINSKDKISYINKYKFSIIEDVKNSYEAIHLLTAINGIIEFELEQLIEEYINELPNRKEEIRKMAEEILPKQIKDYCFVEYEMI